MANTTIEPQSKVCDTCLSMRASIKTWDNERGKYTVLSHYCSHHKSKTTPLCKCGDWHFVLDVEEKPKEQYDQSVPKTAAPKPAASRNSAPPELEDDLPF